MSYANMTNEEILAEKLEIAWSKINQLERERDEARKQSTDFCEQWVSVEAKCDELRAEVERLKADKARLDYIIIGTGIDRGKIDAQMKGAK